MPGISIIVPCHNVAGTVRQTLESISCQSWTDWQAVLVDDGSADSTGAILDAWADNDNRFKVVHQANGGLSRARNAGFAASVGERVLFCDAGDMLEPRALEILNNLLDDNPDCGAACGGWRFVGPDGEDRDWAFSPVRSRLSFTDFTTTNSVNTDSLLIGRKWLEQVGGFDPSMRSCEDWDLWMRLARLGCRYVTGSEPVSRYRMESGSMSRQMAVMLDAGLQVIGVGHRADPRVVRPSAEFAAGAPAEQASAAKSAWVCYCAASAWTQSGGAAADEILALAGDAGRGIEPESLAHHLSFAVPYGMCLFPDYWPGILDDRGYELRSWLEAIETRLDYLGFARRCWSCLTKLIDGPNVSRRLATAIQQHAAGGKRIVLYGAGRNGLSLMRILEHGIDADRLILADDADPARSMERYLPPRKDQLIVVTPWDSHGMCRRLEEAGARHGRDYIVWSDFSYPMTEECRTFVLV